MELFDRLSDQARKMSLVEFVHLNNRLFVIGNAPGSGVGMGYSTHISGPTLEVPRAGRRPGSTQFVQLVAKTDRNDWKQRICVGRASNNDIILRHESVSKLHAYFVVRQITRKLRTIEEMVIVDADSKNGTLQNGRAVLAASEAEQGAALAFGDRLTFGEVECEFVDGATLYKRLKSRGAVDF
ncbi:MAG: FHA domain-containing protein [bacterium]